MSELTPVHNLDDDMWYYPESEVNAAIAELEAESAKLRSFNTVAIEADKVKAARIAELETEVERLTWMLDTALDDLSDSILGPMTPADRAAVIADLDSRWVERGTE